LANKLATSRGRYGEAGRVEYGHWRVQPIAVAYIKAADVALTSTHFGPQ